MRIPYGITLASGGTLEASKIEADAVRMIFNYYMAGARVGKCKHKVYR